MTDNALRCARCGLIDGPSPVGTVCGLCPRCCYEVNGFAGVCRPYEPSGVAP